MGLCNYLIDKYLYGLPLEQYAEGGTLIYEWVKTNIVYSSDLAKMWTLPFHTLYNYFKHKWFYVRGSGLTRAL